ncbi:PREDICTED: uncharacterized protein LOC18602376 isoform X3 [Theobroma cacao]|uniref:Uncharacterized protein LOC18602376 isoform X3 n=1 Tax=Theobroma cacao TaxID=3641 RepID=A0AB32W4T1_THECC|nr:PREDICTED: uncharacterized protein LOC18602376 isoform X3 [Theobroma cacao]
MASTTLTTISSNFQQLHSPRVSFSSCWCFNRSLKFQYNRKILSHSNDLNLLILLVHLQISSVFEAALMMFYFQLRVDVSGIET